MNLKNELDIIKECENAGRIGITGHIRPDGDCVGSCLALYEYLKKVNKNAEVKVFLQEPGDIFAILKGFDEIITDFPEEEPFDVFFVLDCEKDRTGDSVKYIEKAKKTINIDHHISNSGSCIKNVIYPNIGSASEVLYYLLEKEYMDKEIATSIYTGIIHDTGVMQYSNTSPDTLRVAAELMEYGVEFSSIIEETFYEKTYMQTQIAGRVVMESIRFMDGKCVVGCLFDKIMKLYGAKTTDLEGIVNQLRNIKGVECAIFMYETGLMEYKISLRSRSIVDVSKVASYFGGGGHVRAAGCTMHGTFYDCVNNLSERIAEQMK